MIRQLKIQNFQSHDETNLEFTDGVNIIVGSSDSGKTAIIRAIRWLSWNRPSGDALRSRWGGATNVLLETEEGIIRRVKDKKDHYELLREGKKTLVFTAFGTNVPQEINQFLNLDEINLQHQFDSPFLLNDSPGAVASHFNRVARLDKIDSATSTINGWIRGLKSDVEHLESDIETEKKKLSKFDHIDKFEAELEVLEGLAGDLSVLQNRAESLQKDIRKYHSLEDDISKAEEFVASESLITDTLELISRRDDARKQYNSLSNVVKKLTEIKQDEDSINQLLPAEPLIDNLLSKYDQVKALRSDYDKLKVLIKQIDKCQSDIGTTETNLKESEELFHKEMGDICILCDQPIKK